MRTGAAAGHRGYLHDAVCYSTDEEFLAVVVPFLTDGLAAGEPTFAVFGEETNALLRSALPANSGIRFAAGEQQYLRPAAAIKTYREMLATLVAEGATQIRVAGEVPTAPATWDGWCRYESAVNDAYDAFPLWGICTYDTRTTPAAVLADVARTHPVFVSADGGRLPSRDYLDPRSYLSRPRPVLRDPLHHAAPVCELIDPSAARARQAVYDADPGRLGADDIDDLVIAVSETVTNAMRHGRPPVRMRVWVAEERMLVSVTDAGPGPRDPMAGLLPRTDRPAGGLGLWITHQACSHVSFEQQPDGYTVWLTAGDPHFDLQTV